MPTTGADTEGPGNLALPWTKAVPKYAKSVQYFKCTNDHKHCYFLTPQAFPLPSTTMSTLRERERDKDRE